LATHSLNRKRWRRLDAVDEGVKWGLLPKCLITCRVCEFYYRGRCKRKTHCNYKEEVQGG